eukprot:GHVR01044168.1.p1 GENE.GHVR01044168.1~~GHVR01044168.1.p1  ORF type:complete len:141 (-),score=7.25 GHVR01044168.1:1358-1780(-)
MPCCFPAFVSSGGDYGRTESNRGTLTFFAHTTAAMWLTAMPGGYAYNLRPRVHRYYQENLMCAYMAHTDKLTEAMKTELHHFSRLRVFAPDDRNNTSLNTRILSTRWVTSTKYDGRVKARLVVQGCFDTRCVITSVVTCT